MPAWIDTHAHIYLPEFDLDLPEVIVKAQAAGAEHILMPNIDHTSIDRMLEVEARYTGVCRAMMGLHPCSVKTDFESELYRVENNLNSKSFIAVGEIGTDLFWDKTFWEHQVEAFNVQVTWAMQHKLPVVIHCRESLDQTIALVEKLHRAELTGVFHCFSGTLDQARRIQALGFCIGIGGVATFKNGGLDAVIPQVEESMLVLETDSPYLAPVPHRGKRNEPFYVTLIAERIARLRNTTVDEVYRFTTANAKSLFFRNENKEATA
jgi:TatD DNase family protein